MSSELVRPGGSEVMEGNKLRPCVRHPVYVAIILIPCLMVTIRLSHQTDIYTWFQPQVRPLSQGTALILSTIVAKWHNLLFLHQSLNIVTTLALSCQVSDLLLEN